MLYEFLVFFLILALQHRLNKLEVKPNCILYLDLDVFYQFVQNFQELIIANWDVCRDKYSMDMVRE